MKNQNMIKIGSKQTQFFQKCPVCNSLIRIPREMRKFPFTPYVYWEFAYEIDCKNCENKKFNDFLNDGIIRFTKEIKTNIPKEFRKIKTKNTVLYAFNVGIYCKGLEIKGKKTDSYVAINEYGLEFLDEIFPDKWNEEPDKWHFNDGFAQVKTYIGFDGYFETKIEVE